MYFSALSVASTEVNTLDACPLAPSTTVQPASKMYSSLPLISLLPFTPTLWSLLHDLDTILAYSSRHVELEHTFSRSLLIHWTMLSPWSARSSTSNVCAHSLRLGSPSSLMMYRVGKMIEPTPLDLWSLDFSTTARTRSEYSLSKTGRDAFPCLSCVRSSTPKTSAKSAGTASRPIHLFLLASSS
jgi:hypothetical protein